MKIIRTTPRFAVSGGAFGLGCLIAFSFGFQAEAQQPSKAGVSTAPAEQIQIQATNITSDSASIRIKIPGSADNLKIHLNGQDVSSRFSSTSTDCNGATCETGVLTRADGFHPEKDVLTVLTGDKKSGRLRFSAVTSSASTSPVALPRMATYITSKAQSVSSSEGILPPTVAVTTNHPGGWVPNSPWITINGVGYPDVAPGGNCQGAIYLAVVLDRQTLAEKTSAPESSPMCLSNSAALKQYLSSLTANDIVIVGSNFDYAPDAGLDLSAIGGNVFSGQPGDNAYPQGILAIGVPGAVQGTAYAAYFVNSPGYEFFYVFATGLLQEDAFGNYNFESSAPIEFTVSPNDPSVLTPSGGTSAIAISIPNAPANSPQQYVYTPPTGSGGYWLLTLSRSNNLSTYPQYCNRGAISADGTTQYIPNCGAFYPTGSSDAATSTAAYQALATALGNVNAWQMAFLTTVGQAAYGGTDNNIWRVGGFKNYGQASNGFLEFSHALAALGGTPNLTQSLLSPNSAYTFISSPGIGGPLTGNSVESTTVLAAQGQTGFVHGIMQRNLNGLYMTSQVNQDSPALYAAKGGVNDPEFKLTETAVQQPVDWPSSSTTILLTQPNPTCPSCPGADTIAGQVSAYRFISYYLLNWYYMMGLPQLNSHQDDIHYFFTGSYSTSINYHTFDPQNLQSPTDPSYLGHYGCDSITTVTDRFGNQVPQCTINNFAPDNQQLVFDETDFYAVATQMHYEIVYLTNSLQFLATGISNMKDVIAGGNSGAGLALTGAATGILGSQLIPSATPTTHVHASWQTIVNLIGNITSVLSFIPGAAQVSSGLKLITTISTATSLMAGAAGLSGGAGHVYNDAKTLPSAFASFSTQISQLANGSMQDELSTGFDTMMDSVTSDWGRLSTIGPMASDPNNPAFYSPTQLSQTVAVNALNQAASRSFYLSLMPSFYTVQYWPGVSGNYAAVSYNIPDMGGYSTGDGRAQYCSAFYLNPQQNTVEQQGGTYTGLGSISANVSVYYPSPAGIAQTFSKDYSGSAIDFYVIAEGKTGVKGYATAEAVIPVISGDLGTELFTPSGLNIPIDEFVTPEGPMSSVWDNAASSNPSGLGSSSVCNAQVYPWGYGSNPTQPGNIWDSTTTSALPPTVGVGDSPLTVTTTSLSVPASVVQGNAVTLTANVSANGSPVIAGTVFFSVDGIFKSEVNLNKSGTASVTWTDLSLGQHSVKALYGRVDPYDTSSSNPTTLTVFSSAPDLNLSASANSMTVNYGSTSSPITLQLTSVSGMAGTVNLTCSGLPVGMTCSFNPTQVNLTGGGQATSNFTINGGSVSTSSLWIPGIGLLLLPVSIASLGRARKGTLRIGSLACLSVLGVLVTSSLVGCSGGSSPSKNAFQESGTKTVIVNATIGSVTRTIPIQVTIQ